MPPPSSQVSFVGGELTPKIDARIDQAKYREGLRKSLNMIPYKTGALTRRPGTGYIDTCPLANTGGHNYTAIDVPFVFSPTTSFMLQFGHEYIRFYSNGQPVDVDYTQLPFWIAVNAYSVGTYVQHGGFAFYCIAAVAANFPIGNSAPASDPTHWSQQTILEVPTPYNADVGSGNVFEADIRFLSFCQVNDIIYISSPSYPPYKLTRFSNLDWVMEQVPFLTPALLDQNATDVTIASSAVNGSGVTLTATAPAWVTGTYYGVGSSVLQSGLLYNCVTPHTAGTFGADLANGYWVLTSTFNALHVGSTWQLSYVNNAAYIEYDGTTTGGFANGTSTTINVLGGWEVRTYGVWNSDILIQQSTDNGLTWHTVQTLTSRADANFDYPGSTDVLSLYRLVIQNSSSLTTTLTAGSLTIGTAYTILTVGTTDFTKIGASANTVGLAFVATGQGSGTGTVSTNIAGPTNPRVVFSVDNAFINGLVYITGYTDAYHVTANVVTPLLNTGATSYWSEGAWSNYRGFPAAVSSFQQRIVYGGSGYEPQRIWGTVTDDIENFDQGDGSLATDSYAFDLNAPSRGPIQSLIGQLDLFVFFSGAEWIVNSGSTNANGQSSGAAVTATSINAVESSSWGSADGVLPTVVGDVVMFPQRQATSLRQILFSVYSAKYMTTDLTELSDHLFPSGIAQIAYQPRWRKQSLIWVVTQQGTLVSMTYELDKEITGWTPHSTGGGQTDAFGNPVTADNGFESVAVIPGQGNNDDEVWVIVNRLINGVPTRFQERIQPYNWEEDFTGAPAAPFPFPPDAFYVDCGKTITSPGILTFGGLGYLAGRSVVGLADGLPFGPIPVSGAGFVTLPPSFLTSVSIIQIGLPIPYTVKPMRFDLGPDGSNEQGEVKQVDSRFFVRVLNSMGGSVSNGTSNYPTWAGGYAYTVGYKVISPFTLQAFQAVQAVSSFTDPSADPANWQPIPLPSYQPAVPIDYTPPNAGPFGVPQFVTGPADMYVQPQLMPAPGQDPLTMIVGNDALPLTVLAMIGKIAVSKT